MERMNPLWHADSASLWIFLRQTGKAKHSEAPRHTFRSVSHLNSLYVFKKSDDTDLIYRVQMFKVSYFIIKSLDFKCLFIKQFKIVA